MQVLMTENASENARRAAGTLAGAGHTVHACREPGMPGFACVALRGRPCPLEAHPIDVALTVRPYPTSRPLVSEDGVRCAVRRHIPLVVGGEVHPNPFAPWTTVEHPGVDLVDAVETGAKLPSPKLSEHATEVLREAIHRMGVAVQGARAEVRRSGDEFRVQVTLITDELVSSQVRHGIAVRVHQAMREIDRSSRGFDISVVTEQVTQ